MIFEFAGSRDFKHFFSRSEPKYGIDSKDTVTNISKSRFRVFQDNVFEKRNDVEEQSN